MTEYKNIKPLYMSKYNDLSKIYNINDDKKVIKTIYSPKYYYNVRLRKIEKISNLIKNDNILVNNYSILGLNNNNNNNDNDDDDDDKAKLLKLESGYIVLKIPYLRLFKIYKE